MALRFDLADRLPCKAAASDIFSSLLTNLQNVPQVMLFDRKVAGRLMQYLLANTEDVADLLMLLLNEMLDGQYAQLLAELFLENVSLSMKEISSEQLKQLFDVFASNDATALVERFKSQASTAKGWDELLRGIFDRLPFADVIRLASSCMTNQHLLTDVRSIVEEMATCNDQCYQSFKPEDRKYLTDLLQADCDVLDHFPNAKAWLSDILTATVFVAAPKSSQLQPGIIFTHPDSWKLVAGSFRFVKDMDNDVAIYKGNVATSSDRTTEFYLVLTDATAKVVQREKKNRSGKFAPGSVEIFFYKDYNCKNSTCLKSALEANARQLSNYIHQHVLIGSCQFAVESSEIAKALEELAATSFRFCWIRFRLGNCNSLTQH